MNQNQIKKCIQMERIQLNIWQKIEHYFFIIPILILPTSLLYRNIQNEGRLTYIPFFEISMLFVALYFLYKKYKLLKFTHYEVEHTKEDFKAAVKATTIELDWIVKKLTNNVLIAEKHDITCQWDGLKITIIRDGNKIYTNSIIKPSTRSNPFSLGWNKKNLQVFKDNLIKSTTYENKDVYLNLEMINKLSIRGRVVFGIKTIEQYIFEHKLDNEILQALLKSLWLFIENDDLSFWESKIENYNPINILDVSEGNIYTNYENLTEDDFNEIQKYYKNVNTNFLEIISLTIEIGSFYLYSGISEFHNEFILLTNKLYSISNCTLEKSINVSNIYQYYLVSKTNYWGEKKNKTLFK